MARLRAMPAPPPRPPARAPVRPILDPRTRTAVIERRGLPRSAAAIIGRDFYHFLLRASWPQVLGLMAVIFFGSNLLFATLLYVTDAQILNAADGSFLDRYWFSVQTMATIGYGYMAPVDHIAGAITAVESFCGILLLATATGVFFAKFSRPTARVMFSAPLIIATYEGQRTLMFRMANARTTAIVDASIAVTMMRDEVLASGEQVRRLYDLPLRRATSPMFALSWTAYHVIDDDSPLAQETADTMARGQLAVMVTFSGTDDRLATAVHTRHAYTWADVREDHAFVDIIGIDPQTGARFINYATFHDTRPVAPAT